MRSSVEHIKRECAHFGPVVPRLEQNVVEQVQEDVVVRLGDVVHCVGEMRHTTSFVTGHL